MRQAYGLLSALEKQLAKAQGKGFGSGSVGREVAAIKSLLSDHPVELCIDVGGNAGEYADGLLRHFSYASIVVFEPAAVNVQRLQERFKRESRIVIEPYALSHSDGEAVLYSDIEGSGLASLTQRDLVHKNRSFDVSESVRLTTFDAYWRDKLASKPVDILKMDVEGHELDVLNGASEALDTTRIVQFEFGGCNIDTRTYFRDFWRFFSDRGFKLFRVTPFGLMPMLRYKERDEHFTTTNFLALSPR